MFPFTQGHHLCDETMNISIPVFSLQLYNNSTLFWLAQPCLMILSVKYLSIQQNSSNVHISQVKEQVGVLRKIFSYEFVMHQGHAEEVSSYKMYLLKFSLIFYLILGLF